MDALGNTSLPAPACRARTLGRLDAGRSLRERQRRASAGRGDQLGMPRSGPSAWLSWRAPVKPGTSSEDSTSPPHTWQPRLSPSSGCQGPCSGRRPVGCLCPRFASLLHTHSWSPCPRISDATLPPPLRSSEQTGFHLFAVFNKDVLSSERARASQTLHVVS